MRYWLNSAEKQNPEEFAVRSQQVGELYRLAFELDRTGVHLCCVDEKTGIQALERAAPTLLMKPGLVERQEQNYIRHGTQVLIANFDVAHGNIIAPTVQKTRNEQDFVKHIRQTVALHPKDGWIFVLDQLNIHQSESLVRYVVEQLALKVHLGVKGQSGILKSQATRRVFLESLDHRIRFAYTPCHASWLNQIEIWFSLLVRRFLKRGSFRSREDLRTRILAFIEYFNETLAKPFKWTYKGKILTA